ncbi:GlxA family transcriptional regulator [Lacimicrobium sp. SS2-24]|uniref:GlxA family transcriptional regulator n=1 Tax=Lacimicrobium sp. SS2-24 TaxID=2005569 RepID=UPI000B4A8730|nr:GlxA family transcriptional regulator [Lacimicrobium sp. SS2-24]
MLKRKIGFLLFEQMNAQDLVGPMEVFHSVSEVHTSPYELMFIAEQASTYTSESGLAMVASYGLSDIQALDTLIIPGGAGSRLARVQQSICPWLAHIKPGVRRIASVCTGAFILAESGLLDARPATTHWAFINTLKSEYPKIRVKPDSLYVHDGDIATSAGITSGIDLALRLIEEDLGAQVATQVARFLVVHYRRAGDQAQFSEPLRFQQKANTGFASLSSFVLENLHRELSVAELAAHCAMSTRNFHRLFAQQMGKSPAKYVEKLRLDYARQLLVEKSWSLERIADACGYNNTDSFRRAFQRCFSIAPKEYRERFSKRD